MIPGEKDYEFENQELFAIVKAFKTSIHYLQGSKQKIVILIGHKNLRQFTDIKNSSFRQVW